MSVKGLEGHVVVVTGASSGLGEQLARALAEAGAVPVLAARRAERLDALKAEIPGADTVTCDVTEEADRQPLIDTVIERHGRLDALDQQRRRRRDRARAARGRGRVRTRRRPQPHGAVRPLMPRRPAHAKRQRRRDARSIVNIASVMGLRSIGEIPDAAYVASKAGIIGLTRELASQWGRYGIRVNAVAPGFFASEMTAELGDDPEQFPDFLLNRTPLGRGGRTGELDEAVLFLLGSGSSFVTGHVLSVDGGMAIR